jgi:hypothetical protein
MELSYPGMDDFYNVFVGQVWYLITDIDRLFVYSGVCVCGWGTWFLVASCSFR